MALEIRKLHPHFAGEVTGLDLRQPLDRDTAAAVEAAMDEYAVLVFRGQDISDEQQAAFSRNFGELELPSSASNITKLQDRRLGPVMADISNLNRDHHLLERDSRQRLFNLGNRLWHSDSSFRAIPAKFSALSARAIPDHGGETQFADMRAAYDALDASVQAEIGDLICEHSLMFSRGQLGFSELSEEEKAQFEPVRQRLVRVHPSIGRKSLYLASHAGGIVGWPVPEARAFLRDLIEDATRPELVYTHRWRRHDLVMWDNRQTMHRARRFDDTHEVRDMRRTTVAGSAPTVEQAA